ncbi:MAG: response regulator transcription factor [Syntrophales bacterium]
MDQLPEKLIYIVGSFKLQNEMMASLIERETDIKCRVVEDVGHILGLGDQEISPNKLILWDCLGKDPGICLTELEQSDRNILDRYFIAFFNVNPDLQFEEEASTRGVRGFFYEQDPFEKFSKGVRAILNGELWISRKILTKFLEKRKEDHNPRLYKSLLTSREIEILSMVSIGAKNEGIADKLFITPNTVKTHIYNIFKKIGVPNRLQAALWAAKNL